MQVSRPVIYFNNMLAPWQAHDFMTAAVGKGHTALMDVSVLMWLIYKALLGSESPLPLLQAPLSGTQLLKHPPAQSNS